MSAEDRVENENEPKRPPLLWPSGFVLVANSAFGRNWRWLLSRLRLWDKLRSCSSNYPIIQVHYNQCQCLPKAELKTKTNPNGHHFCGCLGSFWFSTRFTRKKVIRLTRKTVYVKTARFKIFGWLQLQLAAIADHSKILAASIISFARNEKIGCDIARFARFQKFGCGWSFTLHPILVLPWPGCRLINIFVWFPWRERWLARTGIIKYKISSEHQRVL